MNVQQVGQHKSSNGYGRRKPEREGLTKSENKIPASKSNASRLASIGAITGTKGGGTYESPSHDRLVYITTCLVGHQVEVQVKNGSVYSGIFHATNADKDFGIILKMACLTKDGSLRGQKSGSESVSKPPSKTLIIPSKELVQVIAKGIAVTRDSLAHGAHCEMQQEIMVDSVISQSRHIEIERELQPWVPDEDGPQPELENIFDSQWTRGWDQFQTNETLFGVKSTFNEELYTTKLEKGPQTRELEKEALRIAREIEGEDTQDLHLAEERGIHLNENFDVDEETRFSSVYRGNKGVDDSGYEENEDRLLDSRNTETFGGVFDSVIKGPSELAGGKSNDRARTSSNSSSMDLPQTSQPSTGVDLSRSGSYDHAKHLASELPIQIYPSPAGENRLQENSTSELYGVNGDTNKENQIQVEDVQLSKSEDLHSSLNLKKEGSDKGGLSPNATSYTPSSHDLSKTHEKTVSYGDLIEGSASGKANLESKSVNTRVRPGSSTSGSDSVRVAAASSAPSLSPSSSVGSLSSEKSTLNPNAKEFKLNPNARSFIPSQSPVRPPSPVSDTSFYFPTSVTHVPHMPGMPMGLGIGPTFGGPPPLIYNPQVPQMQPQAYFHPNVPQLQYGQLLGPRQVGYMPNYIPETPYNRGRDY